MRKVYVAALATLMSTAPAFAEGPRASAGLQLGAIAPLADFGDTSDVGVSISGYLMGDMTYHSAWRLEVGYDRASTSETTTAQCSALGLVCGADAIKRFDAGIQWTFKDTWPEATPYLVGTFGIYNQQFNQNVVGIDFSRSSSDPGISFGGGVLWTRTALWGLGAELRAHGIFRGDDLSNAWYITPSAFLNFRF